MLKKFKSFTLILKDNFSKLFNDSLHKNPRSLNPNISKSLIPLKGIVFNVLFILLFLPIGNINLIGGIISLVELLSYFSLL